MPRHDSIFKRLLRSFFADLLNLTIPEVAARLELSHPVLLDKEFFTPGGRRRELDLLVEVSFLAASEPPLLIHVEVEVRARPDMGRRLWRYRKQIQAVHDSHVLSIVVYLQRGKAGVQVQALDEHLLGRDLAPSTTSPLASPAAMRTSTSAGRSRSPGVWPRSCRRVSGAGRLSSSPA